MSATATAVLSVGLEFRRRKGTLARGTFRKVGETSPKKCGF